MSSEHSNETEAVLAVNDLHVAYGNVEALFGVSLRVDPGEIVSVIGANGAGKTTMLSAIMGLLRSRGEIRLRGRDIASLTVEQRVAEHVSLVPETRELFMTMSVEDNLILGAFRPFTNGDRDYRQTMDEVFHRFPKLKERLRQQAGTLSGGERAQLVLGRALMSKPQLLMLDEPSLGLSPIITREIFSIISDLTDAGTAIVLVEQNARAALQVSTRAYVLENGLVTMEGRSEALLEDHRIYDAYLGKRTRDAG
ncbi:ABC transporter ATP-binding protein [Salipiger sp. P9]|uniref:ABC transporter ATP-binding protein n=1 Tax=Salipiger pentaromativorans TaxID=2943193 RepID=UPI002156FF0A|nr:ABC transporter ATP-binding protein [Salipiger pentaromativorans]MCR8547577.1 ABC transporter ATP-binding protein [Salipiger pentaromativorans]